MRYQQPQSGPVQIDWSNPLTRGLVVALNGAVSVNEAVSGRPTQPNGTVSNSVMRDGVAFTSASASGSLTIPKPAIGYGDVTFMARTIRTANAGSAYLFATYNGAAGIGIVMQHSSISNQWGTFTSSGANRVGSGESAPNDGLPHTYVSIRAANGDVENYRDGVQKAGATGQGVFGEAESVITLHGVNGVLSVASGGATSVALMWLRRLSPSEVAAVSANPWQLFKSPQRAWRAAAGAAAYGLATAAGAYALTGQPPALRTARKLSSSSGTYFLTGAAATALRALQTRIDRGIYVFSGTPAGIATARRLAASAGAFALSGSAAGLRSARCLSTAPGVYQLAGTTASLVYTPAPVLGSYSLAGSSGTFTLAGGAVAYRAARQFAVAPGAFALTGPAAALLRDRRSIIGPGTFATVGSDVAIRAARRIAADVGTFAINGGAAMLGYSSSVQYARAPAGPGYAPQRAEYQVRPAGEIQRRPTDVQRNDR